MGGIKIPSQIFDSDNLDWQTEKKTLNEKCAFLYLNPLMADVTFEVGSNVTKTITAHKLILSIGSPVFFAMFNGNFIESEKKEKTIEVPDVEPETFKSLLGYLYLDKITLKEKNVVSLLYCSQKYMIPLLTKKCSEYLLSNVKPSNAIHLMSQTRLFDLPAFRNKCWEVIVKDSMSSFESDSFAEIHYTTLLDVLGKKDLKRPEIVAFKAALRWATAQLKLESTKGTKEYEQNPKILGPKMRTLLGKAIDHICFSKMSPEEVSSVVVPTGILSADEIVCVFVKITSSNQTPKESELKETPKKSEMKKTAKINKGYYSPTWKLDKYTLFDESRIISGSYSFISSFGFKVDRTVAVTGLSVLSGSANEMIHINIKRNGASCGKGWLICSDENQMKVYIHFVDKIILEPYVEYIVTAGCTYNKFSYYVANEEPYFSSTFSITTPPQNYNYITDIHFLSFS